MASLLKKASAAVLATRTTLLTAAADKQTIVVTGTVSNLDDVNKATYFVTVEIQTGVDYRVIVKDAPVPYGGSLVLNKIVLEPADVVHLTASEADVLDAYISYVEKD